MSNGVRWFVFLTVPLFFGLASVSAAPIYTWEDEFGVTHFSSKKEDPRAEKAALPEINRGDVKLVERKLISCGSHGGINCQAGADTDGSVICYDGFRGASARFRLSCNSPKLEIATISDLEIDGRFQVTVRNSKSVAANDPAVLYRPELGKEFKLEGPEEIEAFGIAEFIFVPKDADPPTGPVDLAQLEVLCANCS